MVASKVGKKNKNLPQVELVLFYLQVSFWYKLTNLKSEMPVYRDYK